MALKLAKTGGKQHTGKYVAYYRVSTQEQGNSGLGLEAQREAAMRFLNGGSWELIGEFTEVESGTRKKLKSRPQLQAALKMASKQGATLLVAKLDRLARDVQFIAELLNGKVPFVCCDFPDADRTYLQMMAVFAEHEARRIGERTKDALGALKRRGVKLGTPNPMAGNVIAVRVLKEGADEFAAQVMPHIREIMAAGHTNLRDIAAALERRGIKTRTGNTKWYPSQVSNLLKRA
jgi:DNA invertase Pin-like site-specific DNA recombinase